MVTRYAARQPEVFKSSQRMATSVEIAQSVVVHGAPSTVKLSFWPIFASVEVVSAPFASR